MMFISRMLNIGIDILKAMSMIINPNNKKNIDVTMIFLIPIP